jgi:hypothetical protein
MLTTPRVTRDIRYVAWPRECIDAGKLDFLGGKFGRLEKPNAGLTSVEFAQCGIKRCRNIRNVLRLEYGAGVFF